MRKKPILVVMAAGMGSRYGGLKQLDPVDEHGHIIMDFSVYDAVRAGFGKVIFVIKKEHETDFREKIVQRMQREMPDIEYVLAFQELDVMPEGAVIPEGRVKPWGTAHAVMCAGADIDAPFAVINADDYYGKQAFVQIHRYLIGHHRDDALCMAGFILKNTLSENGGVTRGICQADEQGYITHITETPDIVKTPEGVAVNGVPVDPEARVSMNMWGFPSPAIMDVLEINFRRFFDEVVPHNPLRAEYLLPVLIDDLLRRHRITVQVLPTGDRWYGVTYAEDRAAVADSINGMVSDGIYRANLYGDL